MVLMILGMIALVVILAWGIAYEKRKEKRRTRKKPN